MIRGFNFKSEVLNSISDVVLRNKQIEIAALCYGEVINSNAFVEIIDVKCDFQSNNSFKIQGSRFLNGYYLVGILHSHPSGAITPSITDIYSMRQNRLPWIIASISSKSVQYNAFIFWQDVIYQIPILC